MADYIDLSVHEDRMVVIFDPFADTVVHKDSLGREFEVKLPETHSERTRAATIMAVGDDQKTRNHFHVGDRILLSWHSGTRLHLIDKVIYGRTWPEDLLRVIRYDEVVASIHKVTQDGPAVV